MNWILYDFNHSFDFTGRATRREFWRFTLTLSLIGILVSALHHGMGPLGSLLFALYVVADLALLPARITLTMRRLHDTGHSGKWLLAPFGLVLIFVLSALVAGFGRGGVSALGVLWLIGAGLGYLIVGILLLVFTLTASDAGTNAYGPPSENPQA